MEAPHDLIAEAYQASRPELLGYLTRLVLRPEVAEELVQESSLRLLGASRRPVDAEGTRAWLFRTGTNLALDYLKRHSTRREILLEARDRGEADADFLTASTALRGSPAMRAIAREHLAVCLACTIRHHPPSQAATLLLIEVYGFSVAEVAGFLDATDAQVKAWVRSARQRLQDRYAETCALVAKQGVCYQCVELSEHFNGRGDDPLAGTARNVDARLAILRDQRGSALGPWHRLMMELVDDILDLPS